jgi:hypothetical protein
MSGMRLVLPLIVVLIVSCTIPNQSRISAEAVGAYEVRQGDTVLSIAEMFGLKPETVFLSNYDLLQEDPPILNPGMVLTILPIDGLYYEWQEGDTIESVAARFAVEPLAIVAWPGNRLDLHAFLDGATLAIAPGSKLEVPGGSQDLTGGN